MRPVILAVVSGGLLASGCQEVRLDTDDDVTVSNPPVPWTDRPAIERFSQPFANEVDVLWVVDNSCSMLEEQARIAANADAFVQHFVEADNLDWHIGFITTDMYTGAGMGALIGAPFERYLTADTPGVQTVFRERILQGNGGPAPERGLDTSWLALTDPMASSHNRGFRREGAALHVVVISDQRDYSTEIQVPEYVSFLRTQADDPEDVSLSAIVGFEGESCSGYVEPGYGYLEVARQTGGVLVSICEEDWGIALDAIGALAVAGDGVYYLKEAPAAETLEVWVEEVDGATYTFEPVTGFAFDPARNSIALLDYDPPPGAVVVARYFPADTYDPDAFRDTDEEDTAAP